MKKFNNKSGFTLIEIIVVLIIVGILAAIALPNLFSNVQKSKAGSAIASMDAIKSSLETYAAQNNQVPTIDQLTATGISTTSPGGSNGFWYGLAGANLANPNATSGSTVAPGGTPAAGDLTYTITATDGTNTVTLTRASSGSFTCSAPTSGPAMQAC